MTKLQILKHLRSLGLNYSANRLANEIKSEAVSDYLNHIRNVTKNLKT